jgi:hypothetical protein
VEFGLSVCERGEAVEAAYEEVVAWKGRSEGVNNREFPADMSVRRGLVRRATDQRFGGDISRIAGSRDSIAITRRPAAGLKEIAMPEQQKAEIIRAIFAAYMSNDRKAVEGALADDFRFTSPYDDQIDKVTYFVRCWRNTNGSSVMNSKGSSSKAMRLT